MTAVNVTAAATALGALGSFVTLILNLKQGRRNGKGINLVHELVNDRSTQQDRRIDQLTSSLAGSDTEIPPRPNGGLA